MASKPFTLWFLLKFFSYLFQLLINCSLKSVFALSIYPIVRSLASSYYVAGLRDVIGAQLSFTFSSSDPWKSVVHYIETIYHNTLRHIAPVLVNLTKINSQDYFFSWVGLCIIENTVDGSNIRSWSVCFLHFLLTSLLRKCLLPSRVAAKLDLWGEKSYIIKFIMQIKSSKAVRKFFPFLMQPLLLSMIT